VPEETLVLRPTANGTVNAWTPKGALEAWQEVAQEATEPAEPLTSRGIVSPAEANRGQSIHFRWPELGAGDKIVSAVVHFNGNWTTKFRINASDSTGFGITESEIEASTGTHLHWANGETLWINLKGATGVFPWTPWSLAQLEKLSGATGNFQLTFITGKASVTEVYETYVVVKVQRAESGKTVGEGSAVITGGAGSSGKGIKVARGQALIASGARAIDSGKAIAVGQALVQAGARFLPAGSAIVLGSATVTGGGVVADSAGRLTGEGSPIARGGARVLTAGVAIRTDAARVQSGSAASTKGHVIVHGDALVTVGGQSATTALVVTGGVAIVRGGARVTTAGGVAPSGPPPPVYVTVRPPMPMSLTVEYPRALPLTITP